MFIQVGGSFVRVDNLSAIYVKKVGADKCAVVVYHHGEGDKFIPSEVWLGDYSHAKNITDSIQQQLVILGLAARLAPDDLRNAIPESLTPDNLKSDLEAKLDELLALVLPKRG